MLLCPLSQMHLHLLVLYKEGYKLLILLLLLFSNLALSNGSKQNSIKMALKCLFFSEKLKKSPSRWDLGPSVMR